MKRSCIVVVVVLVMLSLSLSVTRAQAATPAPTPTPTSPAPSGMRVSAYEATFASGTLQVRWQDAGWRSSLTYRVWATLPDSRSLPLTMVRPAEAMTASAALATAPTAVTIVAQDVAGRATSRTFAWGERIVAPLGRARTADTLASPIRMADTGIVVEIADDGVYRFDATSLAPLGVDTTGVNFRKYGVCQGKRALPVVATATSLTVVVTVRRQQYAPTDSLRITQDCRSHHMARMSKKWTSGTYRTTRTDVGGKQYYWFSMPVERDPWVTTELSDIDPSLLTWDSTIALPARSPNTAATLSMTVFGYTTPDFPGATHTVRVTIGSVAQTLTVVGNARQTFTIAVPASVQGVSLAPHLEILNPNPAIPQALVVETMNVSYVAQRDPQPRASGFGVRAFHPKAEMAALLDRTAPQFQTLYIGPSAMLSRLSDLVAFHTDHDQQTARMIDVAAFYDWFNYGVATPDAIKAAVPMMVSKGITYMVLVGGDSADPRQYMSNQPSIVPGMPMLDDFQFRFVSDTFYTINTNIVIGRFPARTPDEVGLMATKAITFGQNRGHAYNVTNVVDPENPEFATQNTTVLSHLHTPNGVLVQHIGWDTGYPQNARAALVGAWNNSSRLILYTGHANDLVWSGDEVLTVPMVGHS